MKKLILFIFAGFFLVNSSTAQKYFGKTYTPTQNVDEYFDKDDVKKEHTVMGTTELGQGFRKLEKVQAKIMKLAKEKGADGVIFRMEEEVLSTSSSGSGVVNNKDKKKTVVSGGTVSTTNKHKKIYATFIKYQ
ncbi:MAG: hypothetical protein EOO88_23475 [Pedobacter sp.]|nr:MAG: hypothetical protein EOO88_23475 [Pedobacter sp.]